MKLGLQALVSRVGADQNLDPRTRRRPNHPWVRRVLSQNQHGTERRVHSPRRFGLQPRPLGHGDRTRQATLHQERLSDVESPPGGRPHHPQPTLSQRSHSEGVGPFFSTPRQQPAPVVGEVGGPTRSTGNSETENLERARRVESFAAGLEEPAQLIIGGQTLGGLEQLVDTGIELSSQSIGVGWLHRPDID